MIASGASLLTAVAKGGPSPRPVISDGRTGKSPPALMTASQATPRSESLGVGIKGKITGAGDRFRIAGGRGDHRAVVGTQLERRCGCFRERRTQLGVRRHAAHDRDPLPPGPLRSFAGPLDERP